MQQDQLKAFFEKFANGTNTEAEHQQFIDWLKTIPYHEVEAILEKYNFAMPETRSPQEVDPVLISHIEAALDQYEMGKEKKPARGKVIFLRSFLKLVAACLVAGLLAVVAHVALSKKETKTIAKAPSMPLKPAGAPGGNKATLTLSDGSTIILDDASNGKVANQGSAQVTKLANGQLVYTALNDRSAAVVFNTLTTPRGGQFKLTLPDGSKVWLNTVSSIRYPTIFAGNERKVEITGEAYFEIAHDASKPFKVGINGTEVKVLGTHFNISGYNEESSLKTTLLEGSISLTKATKAVMLSPGQQAQVNNANDIKVVNDVDLDEVVAWKNGYFSFHKADLQTVMRQIARWYDMEIVYEGEIPARQFGGKIDQRSNVTEVLKILQESNVHFKLEEKKIIVRQ